MTHEELVQLMRDHRSVCGVWIMYPERPMPAAWVLNMNYQQVVGMLPRLKPYNKPWKWKQPRALLPERGTGPLYPQPGDLLKVRGCEVWKYTVVSVFWDSAYCREGFWRYTFVPFDIIESVL